MKLLEDTLNKIEPQSQVHRTSAKKRLDNLAIPHWSLGKLMDLALDLAGMTRNLKPRLSRKVVITCAGDHGIVEEGVSAFPQEVTVEMVKNFIRGGASINALAKTTGTDVKVADFGVAADLSELSGKLIDLKVDFGTKNFCKELAMTREQAIIAIENGIGIVNELSIEYNVFATGDMGIGNTTPSAAICSLLTGLSVKDVTGTGTGINEDSLKNKIAVIEKALSLHQPDNTDGIDILSKIGGFEIAGIAGIILGAAANKKPVVIDGFISTAGALIAQTLCPESTDYMICAHKSVEKGHIKMLELLNKEAYLDLSLRLGEGTGAALCMPLLDAAKAVLTEVMTFEEASVSTSNL